MQTPVLSITVGWAVWGAGIASSAVAAPVDLTPRFELGAELRFETQSVIVHRVQVELAEVDERIEVETVSQMRLVVESVDSNGTAQVAWTLEFIALKSDGAVPGIDGLLDFDSREPGQGSSPLGPMFGRLVQQPVRLWIDRAGRVVRFEGIAAGGGVDPLSQLVQGFFSKEAFEQLPLLVTAGAPTPAKVRSSWTRRMTITMPLGVGSIDLEQGFLFKRMSPRRGFAQLEMKGTIEQGAAVGGGGLLGGSGHAAGGGLPPELVAALGGNLQIKQGQTRGHYTWDYVNGQLHEGETWMSLETTLTTSLGEMMLEQRMTSSVRRLEAERGARRRRTRGANEGDKPAEQPDAGE